MPALLHDRYLEISPTHVCDLATADVITADAVTASERREPVLPSLLEVFDHGRDGRPRAVTTELRPSMRRRAAADRIARDAAAHGCVPIAVQVYVSLAPLVREQLAGRTLVLIASERDGEASRRALLDAASTSPRPHVLVTIRSGTAGTPSVVREARAAYAAPRSRVPLAPVYPTDVQQQIERGRRAAAFTAVGRHAAAERLLRDVAGALTRRGAWAPAVATLVALGRLLMERGRPADAARTLEQAAAAAVTGRDERAEVDARIWLAMARIDMELLTAGESVCRAVLLTASLSNAQRTLARAVLTYVLLLQGRTADATDVASYDAAAADGLDPVGDAFARAMSIRALLADQRVFDAGLAATALLASVSTAEPLAQVIAWTCHLRILTAAGDLDAAQARLRDIGTGARVARAPLRMLRARLIWLDALRRAGRVTESERELRVLERLSRVAPPLLRHEIMRQRRVIATELPAAPPRIVVSGGDLVRLAQDEEDDRAAVHALVTYAARQLEASRIDVWSCDAGPATIIGSVGTGLPSTIGERVMDAGIAIGPEASDPPMQLGLPIRLGTRLLGAVVARWPADRQPTAGAVPLLELLTIVAAPRLDGWLHRTRLTVQAATLMPELVGVSAAITHVRQAVARAAAAPFSVLVEGESGVGKELIARALHHLSARRQRRFCDINCAALPDEILESELFGHAKGAFSGALADRPGLFEDADGGTVFLDEVADLSPRAQAKLLRVLQQQEVRRVGENFARHVDVRVVAAANRDMRAEAEQGRFRQDLLYRIDVVRISVPPLRDRPEDIPGLAQHFWAAAAGRVGTAAVLTPAVIAALAAYDWPGNVRELQNVIAGLAVAAPARGRVPAELLPGAIGCAAPIRTTRLADARDQFERRFIEAALARAGGSRAGAARALGLSRQGLLKIMERLHVDQPE